MSNTDGNRDRYTDAPTTERLITHSLGYCCIWRFFSWFKQTSVIALRLGVAPRTVRKWKALARDRGCEGCKNCMVKAKKP